MANYCAASDIQIALGYEDTFSSSTRPTLTQVNTIIGDITNEIDLYLSMVGISSQPTDSRILGRLSQACKYGSAAEVGFGYLNNSADVGGTLAETYYTRYKEILEEIKEKPELYGVTADASAMYISNQVIDGTYTESEINDLYQDSDYEV